MGSLGEESIPTVHSVIRIGRRLLAPAFRRRRIDCSILLRPRDRRTSVSDRPTTTTVGVSVGPPFDALRTDGRTLVVGRQSYEKTRFSRVHVGTE